MTPLPARFPARLLLKVVSIVLGTLVVGLLAAILIIPIVRDESHAAETAWIAGPVLLIPGLYILKLIVDSFSVLEVDEKGVRIRKWIGGIDLDWTRIGSVRYWERIQHVEHVPVREYFAELCGPGGERLARLKSSYEPAAYVCLLECARARNIRIDQ